MALQYFGRVTIWVTIFKLDRKYIIAISVKKLHTIGFRNTITKFKTA